MRRRERQEVLSEVTKSNFLNLILETEVQKRKLPISLTKTGICVSPGPSLELPKGHLRMDKLCL